MLNQDFREWRPASQWPEPGRKPALAGSRAVYPVPAMNLLLVQRPIDAWAATISKQNG